MSSNSNSDIQFPLLDLGEHLPQKYATIELYKSHEDLGLCFPGTDIDRRFGSSRKLYDRSGTLIRITGFHPKPRFSILEKLKTILSPFSVHQTIQLELKEGPKVNPNEFSEKIFEMLKTDSGDLLLQYREISEWKNGFEKHRHFPEIFDFVIEGISPS